VEQNNPANQGEQRRLAAIMFTDIAGFSRQMGADESRTLRLLALHNQIIQQAATAHHGAVIKTIGDAFLVDFPSVVNAVQCAQQIQAQFRTHNAEQRQDEQIHVRIGIHLGDIVQQHGDVFGDGVNVASRLQGLAEPDTICISHVVYNEVTSKLTLGAVVPLGKPQLKNIAQRQNIYLLLSEPPTGLRQRLQMQSLKLSRRIGFAPRMTIVVLVLLAAGLIIDRYLLRPPPRTQDSALRTQEAKPPLPLPDKPSIAIMPFVNMSNDPEQEYFSDGITEDITSSLSKISSLFVIARNSAFTYKGKAVKVQDVSRELGVRYVLDGSVLRAGEQVRIATQLIDAATGEHLWSERYDRPFTDILVLQDEVVQKIVKTLNLHLTLLEQQGVLIQKTTDNLEAYDYVLRGVESFFRYTLESTLQARRMFEKAVALDPHYAVAYAALGATYSQEWILSRGADPQTLERALALAQQAITLDDSLALAHSLLSVVYAGKKQYDQAIAEGERAIALNPNGADRYTAQANVLTWAGRAEEAISMAKQSIRLNPHSPPGYLFQLGWAYRLTGRYDKALPILKDVVRRSPDLAAGYLNLAFGYLYQWAYQR
jgi:adenylate cyclase